MKRRMQNLVQIIFIWSIAAALLGENNPFPTLFNESFPVFTEFSAVVVEIADVPELQLPPEARKVVSEPEAGRDSAPSVADPMGESAESAPSQPEAEESVSEPAEVPDQEQPQEEPPQEEPTQSEPTEPAPTEASAPSQTSLPSATVVPTQIPSQTSLPTATLLPLWTETPEPEPKKDEPEDPPAPANPPAPTDTPAPTPLPANNPPVAIEDSIVAKQDSPMTVAVLFNDSDPDGDTLAVTSVTDGANGTVTIDGDNVVYTPDAGFTGTDSFTYTISDGNGGTDTATESVVVVP